MPCRLKRGLGFSLLLLVGLAGLTLLGAAGCRPETRHQVLTIFFTGVPPLAEETGPAGEGELVAAIPRRTMPERWEEGPYTHGPYGAKHCDQCHVMAPAPEGQTPTRVQPGRFAQSFGEMCLACHQEKSPERARNEGLWLHGPAAACMRCHHPHLSRQPFMLRRAGDELCRSCHSEGLIHDRERHEGEDACLSCHNPHLGADAMMLREDYEEVF
ncbi:cytochrome c3 family protein [Desulfurivibrio sp. C05AmB]|uniref:cytochrome c3 family protein n=1 Tax=Desulfurivibrio sp. C05AmB TaxID=3374371 RepID=UPI00376F0C87